MTTVKKPRQPGGDVRVGATRRVGLATVKAKLHDLSDARRAELWAGRHGAKLVRAARAELKLSQIELARLLGVGQAFLCHVEMGRKRLTLAVAAKLASIVEGEQANVNR